jgi:acetylornithine deacetylase/succinyl-diaminopimelate desuccinylase-like protein
MKKLTLFFFLLFVFANQFPVQGQSASTITDSVRAYRQAHEREILAEFVELLSLPNIASDLSNIRRNATLISQMLEKRGVRTRLLEVPEAPPVVWGEIDAPGATRTLIFYAHYDGQPVEAAQWGGGVPLKAVLRANTLEIWGK